MRPWGEPWRIEHGRSLGAPAGSAVHRAVRKTAEASEYVRFPSLHGGTRGAEQQHTNGTHAPNVEGGRDGFGGGRWDSCVINLEGLRELVVSFCTSCEILN